MENKLVVLKLVGLKYSGQSIGDDLTVEAELAGKRIGINKKLSVGQTAKLKIDIGQFVTSQPHFTISGAVRVNERDPVFNDSNATNVNHSLNLQNMGVQRSVHRVQVVESLGVMDGAVAQFDIELEALVLQATRYIAETDDGWLRVQMEDDYTKVPLPAALKVELMRLDTKREYFTISEGVYRGRKASVKLNADGSSHLTSLNPQTSPVRFVYSITKRLLSLNGQSYQAKDYPETPWVKGVYDIAIPDAPHAGGLNYPGVKRAKTWFRIGHQGDRYLHTGRHSLGCITIVELERWDQLYAGIVGARQGDSLNIGTLQVVD